MIGLGLLGLVFSLALAGSAIADARQTALLFGQAESTDEYSQGFVPIIAPPAEIVGRVAAPTLPSPTTVPSGNVPATSSTSVVPTSQPVSGQNPAAGGNSPTATALPIWIPDRVVIPAISLDAPVVPATLKRVDIDGTLYRQWVAPGYFAAGWHGTSATLGVPGNTVLNGHHNARGEVFRYLVNLQAGDLILVYSGDKQFAYAIALVVILPEKYAPLDVRLKNAQWIEASQDERLTLVTCWPYINNTHRLIIVATRLSLSDIDNYTVTPRRTPRAP